MTGHNHTLPVTAADVAAGVEKTYMSQGAGHDANTPHMVTLGAQDFADLANGITVTKMTTDSNHNHGWTISCT